jgi:chromosome segregation ATPase
MFQENTATNNNQRLRLEEYDH